MQHNYKQLKKTLPSVGFDPVTICI